MILDTKAHLSFRNSYLLGLATASTILALGLNQPTVSADSHETNQVTAVTTDLSTPQTETVEVKRVIYFHLMRGSQIIHQVSHAHRQVPTADNPTPQWTIDPFEEIEIPQQAGFKPFPRKIPTITVTDDLSCFDSPIDIFYHPLGYDDGELSVADNKDQTKADKDQTSGDAVAKDEQTTTDKPSQVDTGVQSETPVLVDSETNTIDLATTDEATQKNNDGIDTATETDQISQHDQESQTNLISTAEQGVGDSEVQTVSEAVGNNQEYLYKDQNMQTDNLPVTTIDSTTMTDDVAKVPTIDTGVGNDEGDVSIDDAEEHLKHQGTQTDTLVVPTIDSATMTNEDSKVQTTDTGIGNNEVASVDTAIGDDDNNESLDSDQGTQTGNLSVSTVDGATMTDDVTKAAIADTGVGDNEVASVSIAVGNDDEDLNQDQGTQTNNSAVLLVDNATMTDPAQGSTVDAGVNCDPLPVADADTQTDWQTNDSKNELPSGIDTETGEDHQGNKREQNQVPLTTESTQTGPLSAVDATTQTSDKVTNNATQTVNSSLIDQAVQTTGQEEVKQPLQIITPTIDPVAQTKQEKDNSSIDKSPATSQEKQPTKQSPMTSPAEAPLADESENSLPSAIQQVNEQSPGFDKTDDDKPTALHQRVRHANQALNSLAKEKDSKQKRPGRLPQTGNHTNSVTTIIGLAVTLLVAGLSLFSLTKQVKNK